eukprot:TRINITY_DN47986_c0_g1_i1.p1 TRINITY_DN47986_c0_g1~~TRINITY_DN47986_c0_g1_i1.p1  ORF type:complete len:480 (-),score=40.52 TRINITY_DN47986_c0_g1_i1:273-1619(-)
MSCINNCDNICAFRLFTALVMCLGLVASGHFIHIVTFESYDLIINMYDRESLMQTNALPLFGLSWRYFNVICIIASFTMFTISCIGYVSQFTQSANGLCTYYSLAIVLAVFFIALGTYSSSSATMFNSFVDHQAKEWCNPDLLHVYTGQLGCQNQPWTHQSSATPACGPECQVRVNELRKLGGCTLLDRLCHDFTFKEVGIGRCEAQEADASKVLAPTLRSQHQVRALCCKVECDARTSCSGYSFKTVKEIQQWHGSHNLMEGYCELVMHKLESSAPKPGPQTSHRATASTAKEAEEKRAYYYSKLERKEALKARCGEDADISQWIDTDHKWPATKTIHIVSSDSTTGHRCWSKTAPRLLEEASGATTVIYFTSVASVVALFMSAISAIILQYTLITRRKGKKGLCALVLQMICPCCGESTALRKTSSGGRNLQFDETSSESESGSDY